jgi:hypothetical protein
MSQVVLQLVEIFFARWRVDQFVPKMLKISRQRILWGKSNVEEDAFVGLSDFGLLPCFLLLRRHQYVVGGVIDALIKEG